MTERAALILNLRRHTVCGPGSRFDTMPDERVELRDDLDERLTRTPRRLLVSRARDRAPGNHLAGIGESRPETENGRQVTREE